MPWLALAVFAVLAFVGLRKASEMEETANVEKARVDDVFDRIGTLRGVDPDLLRAIAFVESNLDASAVRWKPPYDVSVGMMQILCTPPADAQLGDNYVCQNKLYLPDQWPTTFDALKDVELNVDIGAQILASNIRSFGYPRGLAMYNDFAARHAAPNGPFPNDGYVNRVIFRFNQLKGPK